MFFWRRVAPQIPEDGLKPTATPGYTRNFRDLNDKVAKGMSFSGYERNSLFLNRKGVGFSDLGGLFDVDFADDARAVASVDWDQDGNLDILVTNRTAPQVRILKNKHSSTSSFLAIRLIGNGKSTNRDAIGARVTLAGKGSQKQIRTKHAGEGFLAQSSGWIHFGLGSFKDEDLELTVSWPGGAEETISGLKAGARYSITQGEGAPRELPPTIQSMPRPNRAELTGGPASSSPMSAGLWVATRLPFPMMSFTNAEGDNQSTKDLLGKPALINLWATWCVPCMKELKMFADRADELKKLGVTVLALNVDGLAADKKESTQQSSSDAVLQKLGYDLMQGTAHLETLAMTEILIEYLSGRRKQLSIPTSFLVDSKGQVVAVYQAPVSWEQLARDLKLIDEQANASLLRAAPRTGRWVIDPRKAVNETAYLNDYATLFAKNGFPNESQRIFEMAELRSRSGQDATAYYNQAKSASQQGKKQLAMKLYREAIRRKPRYGQALTGLGALLLTEKRSDEAEQLFKQALDIDPNHATALINLAMIEQARGDNESAINRLKLVLARNPEFAQAQFNLGSLLAAMKRYQEAVVHLEQAVELNPKMTIAHMNLGIVHAKLENWSQAEGHLQQVPKLNPRMMTSSLHIRIGNLQAKQQRHNAAIASFQAAISLGAKDAELFTRLGSSLIAIDERNAALEAFKKAIEIDPKFEGARQAIIKHRL